MPEGSYTVKWRVTSIDGHVVEGRYDFAVAATGKNRPTEDAGESDTSAQAAGAQSGHHAGHHGGSARGVAAPYRQEPVPESAAGRAASSQAASIEHGLTLAASAFLAGLAPFVALVWLPAIRQTGVAGHGALRSFGVLAWALLCVLAVAGSSGSPWRC